MVARTKSKIACFAAPSFHDGNRPPDVAVCAGADAARNGADKAGSVANVESRTRRLIPEDRLVAFMRPSSQKFR
jgi:hypothetical protein